MRPKLEIFQDRRVLGGIAFVGLAAAAVLVWTRAGFEDEANARGFDAPVAKNVAGAAPPASPAPAQLVDPAPISFARFEDYFDRSFYGGYSYASPPRTAWPPSRPVANSTTVTPPSRGNTATATPSTPQPPPQSAFAIPSVADVVDPASLVRKPEVSLSTAASIPNVANVSSAAAVAAAPPSSSPLGLFTNSTPFHLFVTSDPVSAVAATSSGAPSAASLEAGGSAGTSLGSASASASAGVSAAGASAIGTATSAASTVTSVLHK